MAKDGLLEIQDGPDDQDDDQHEDDQDDEDLDAEESDDASILETIEPGHTWYLTRVNDFGVPEPAPGESGGYGYCLKGQGPTDVERVRAKVGGGRYRLIVKRGRAIKTRRYFRIDGAPHVETPRAQTRPDVQTSAPRESLASTLAPGVPVDASTLLVALERISSSFERALASVAARSGPSVGGIDINGFIALAEHLRPTPVDPFKAMDTMFELANKLNDGRSGAGRRDSKVTWAEVAADLAPDALEMFREIFVGRPVRRVRAVAAAVQPPVAGTEPAAAVEENETEDAMLAHADLLVRMIAGGLAEGTTVEALAAAVRAVIPAKRLAPLRLIGDRVGEMLGPWEQSLPAVTTERGVAYAQQLIAELVKS